MLQEISSDYLPKLSSFSVIRLYSDFYRQSVAATRGHTTETVHTKGISLNTIMSQLRVPTNRRMAATMLLGSPSCKHLHKKS